MKNKLIFLTSVSLKRKFKTKWFLITNILLALVISAVINLDTIITFFGGDFDKEIKVYVVDNTGYSFDTIKSQIETTTLSFSEQEDESNKYNVILYNKSFDEAKKLIEKENNNLAIEINEDNQNVIKVSLLSEGYIETIDYQLLQTAINNSKVAIAMVKSEVSQEVLNKIYSPITIDRIYLDESKSSEDESMEVIMSTVFPVVILPFFMLTIFLVQMIGAEVNDEKTTRGMEIIISNVSPKTHFFSKILSGNIFIITQSLMLFIYGAIGMLIRNVSGNGGITNLFGGELGSVLNSALKTGMMDKMIYIIPLTLILMVLTLISYSLLAGILASMTTNAEDFSQLQTPIIMISLAGYYLSMMAGMFNGALFIKVLSYVPLISAILSPSLLVLGQIGIIDVIISIIIVIIVNYILIKYGLKIYKAGILNYTSKDLWKKMFKAIKS